MHTVVSSATKTVTIGHDQPFCIIGERINPTGRKKFQEELRAGDLSSVEADVKSQVAGGATMLDINMGAPLVDEADLLAKSIILAQSLTDLPLCIDSSVVEALEAGLSVYQGRALRDAHAAHRIFGGQFDRRRELLRQVLVAHEVPEDVRTAWLAHVESLRAEITTDASGACR